MDKIKSEAESIAKLEAEKLALEREHLHKEHHNHHKGMHLKQSGD